MALMSKFIHGQYLKYLFKSHKHLLMIITIISFVIMPFFSGINLLNGENFNNIYVAVNCLAIMFGCVASFFLPIYFFKFLYNKKSVDMYYSLPIKKEQLFLTTFLFSLLIVVIPISINYLFVILEGIHKISGFPYLGLFILMIFLFLSVQSLVTFVCMHCNNLIDSFVINILYMIVPMIVYFSLIMLIQSVETVGNGNYADASLSLLQYISLVYQSVQLGTSIDFIKLETPSIILWMILDIIFIVRACYLFVHKKAEDSQQQTSSVLAYPTMIGLMICAMLLWIYIFKDMSLFINLFEMIVIFIVYMILIFVQKRKIKIDMKSIIVFVCMNVLCLATTSLCQATNGFGLIREYVKDIQSVNRVSLTYYDDDKTYAMVSSDKNVIQLVNDFQHQIVELKSQENKNADEHIYSYNFEYNCQENYYQRNYGLIRSEHYQKAEQLFEDMMKTIKDKGYKVRITKETYE